MPIFARQYLRTVFAAAICVGASLSSGNGSFAAEPNPASIDAEFLKLPAFDLERVDGAAQVQVGDSVILRMAGLAYERPKELRLQAPPGTESLTDQGWEIHIEVDTPTPPGEYRIRATPLKAGKITLPSLAIVRATAQEEGSSAPPLARTNPMTLEVASAIKPDDPKPGQPVDMRPPISLRFPWWALALAAAFMLALGITGFVAYRRWRGRTARPTPAKPVEPPKPEDEVALSALAELERNGPLRKGEFKAHYFKVSEILKNYIGARYRFDASESTTREMISQLEEKRVLEDSRLDRLETLFGKLDLVKFTDHVPLPDEGQMITELAREFVRATRRPPEIAGPSMGGTMR